MAHYLGPHPRIGTHGGSVPPARIHRQLAPSRRPTLTLSTTGVRMPEQS
jgi:hypothetical protein